MNWAIKEQTTLLYCPPETTPKNAYIERLHRTARQNLLALNQFGVIEHTIIGVVAMMLKMGGITSK
jgi:hypothetical protein